MVYLLVFINLGLPALGIWSLEQGGFAPMLEFPFGYANGATRAYMIHAFWFLAGGLAGLTIALRKTSRRQPILVISPPARRLYLFVTSGLFCAISLLALGAGGLDVLFGNMNKADLRVARDNMGLIGTVLTVSLKWYMPCAFAVFAVLGREPAYDRTDRFLILIAAIALVITAVSTGFKTTVLFVFQPYLVLRFWRLGVARAFVLVAGACVITLVLSYLFDGTRDVKTTVNNLQDRVTNYQGDLAWGIWEKATMGEPLPSYARTFLSIPGSRFLAYATGVDRGQDPAAFASYYFGPSATVFGGYPIEGVEQGVNNQATLFGEAVIAAGPRWYMVFSFGAGVVFGAFIRVLRRFVYLRDPVLGPVWATFLCTSGLMWLMGNGAASMFYAINLAGLILAGIYIRLLLTPRRSAAAV
jgi:hypothetical protein